MTTTQTESISEVINRHVRDIFRNIIPARFSPAEGGRAWETMDLREVRESRDENGDKVLILAIFAKRSDGMWFREIQRIDGDIAKCPAAQMLKGLEGQVLSAYVRLDSRRTCDCDEHAECAKHRQRTGR